MSLPSESPVHAEPQEWHGLLHSLLQSLRVGSGHLARILSGRQVGDQHLDLELALPLVDPTGRVEPGRVRIEGQNQPVGREALQQSHMLGGERSPAGGDGPIYPRLRAADHVRVALAHDGLAGADDLLAVLVQPVEHLALVVGAGLRGRVHVLRPRQHRAAPALRIPPGRRARR